MSKNINTESIKNGIIASIFCLINNAPDQVETLDDARMFIANLSNLVKLHDEN